MKKILIPIAVIAAGASAYWYQQQAENDNVLSYVPADTPFFTGQLTPFPIKDYIASAPNLIDPKNPTHIESLYGEESPSIHFLTNLLSTYEDSLKDADLLTKNFGLADEIRAYFYTLGLLPVLKVEVENPQAIWDLLDKNEQETDFTHTEGELKGLKYRIYPMVEDDQGKPINLIVAQSNGMLTATIQSSFVSEDLLAMALGIKKPSKSLADTHMLEDIMQQHQFMNNSVGFVNHVEIIKGLTSEDDNQLARQLTELTKDEDTAFQLLHSAACKEELRGIAQNWPRTAFGYTQVDISKEQSTLGFAAVLESKNQPILNALKTLRGYIPNYTQNFDDNVIATSIGLDVGQLSSALTDIWANLKTPRFQCGPLADIQYQIDASGESLAMLGMGSSMAANVKGISTAIFDYAVSQDNDQPRLESLDALLAIHVKNPVNLFNSIKMFVPELQQIDLTNNGPAVSLNKVIPISSRLNLNPQMAIKGDHFVIYNGNKGLQEAEKLSLETLSAEGVYQLSFDTKKILTPIADAVELAGEIIPEEAMFLKDYDTRMNINVDINDQGIRLDSTMNHKAAVK
ncbi:hypothetical protein [Psychromonas sp. GE-S-Ul-11]|uniref:hypothetical protein n=1 Tax=unclassified Psychromonas TaxID=2614957 RepID=UPI00390CD25A